MTMASEVAGNALSEFPEGLDDSRRDLPRIARDLDLMAQREHYRPNSDSLLDSNWTRIGQVHLRRIWSSIARKPV